jgi:hypothetical protein
LPGRFVRETELHGGAGELSARLKRLRFVAAHFEELQGWRKVPAGLLMLLFSPLLANWAVEQGCLWFLLVDIVLVVVVPVALAFASVAYYHRTFGRVEPKPWLDTWPSRGILVWGSFDLLLSLENHLDIPFSLVPLGMAWFFGRRPGAWRERPWCGVLALTLFLASFGVRALPVFSTRVSFSGTPSTLFHEMVRVATGLGLIVIGLLDHALLVRYLPRPPAEEGE